MRRVALISALEFKLSRIDADATKLEVVEAVAEVLADQFDERFDPDHFVEVCFWEEQRGEVAE